MSSRNARVVAVYTLAAELAIRPKNRATSIILNKLVFVFHLSLLSFVISISLLSLSFVIASAGDRLMIQSGTQSPSRRSDCAATDDTA